MKKSRALVAQHIRFVLELPLARLALIRALILLLDPQVAVALGLLLPLPGTPGRGLGRGASDAWRRDARMFQVAREVIVFRVHPHLTPLPCPLPGVPGRGRNTSSPHGFCTGRVLAPFNSNLL